MDNYSPNYNITEKSARLLYQIARDLERIDIIGEKVSTPKLRRENRIKTIRSSLYIEANSLSLEQVSDIVHGKKVAGPQQDINEVKGAIDAYEHLLGCDPYSVSDLLEEHRLMMKRVMPNAGRFRNRGVGVFAGNTPIHVAPSAELVPRLVEQLFEWYKISKIPDILKSCIFHYEFEFIHPFADGNGRTGRLWQTLLLYQENAIFGWLPIETIIAANQKSYYNAIDQSTQENDSGIFAEFMLEIIAKAVSDFCATYEIPTDIDLTNDEKIILRLIRNDPKINYDKISKRLGKTPKTVGRTIAKLKERNIITRVGSNKAGFWNINTIEPQK